LTVKGVDHHFSLSRDFQSQEALAPPPNGYSGPDPLGLSTSMEGPSFAHTNIHIKIGEHSVIFLNEMF